ncbi:MAG: biotin--[acetyl-CoA-carboxylase] ligase [Candidatus Omnitrophota bacterium]|nr:biotin--[acetyl-CoA-carboxylase] ligase [Candidatus Omnitrophota bacterium]
MLIGNKICCYKNVTSTNDIAYRLAKQGKKEGLVVLAEYQSEGRGRLGRRWISPAGKSILFSFISRPPLLAKDISGFTRQIAVAVARAINKTTGLRPRFKWPNDLMLDNKKVSGILTRMSTKSNKTEFVIAGIGINVNIDPGQLVKGATSLKRELGRSLSRPRLVRAMLDELNKEYLRIKKSGD